MTRVPVTSQNGIGDCSSHALAQLVDAWRFTHDKPQGDRDFKHRTNPLVISLAYRRDFDEDDQIDLADLGIVAKDGLAHLKNHGSCNDEVVMRYLETTGPFNTMSDLCFRFRCFQNRNEKEPSKEIVQGIQKCLDPNGKLPARQLPGKELICNLLLQPNEPTFCYGLLADQCQGKNFRQIYPNLQFKETELFKVKPEERVKTFTTLVHSYLDSKEPVQPVGIDICSQVLKLLPKDHKPCDEDKVINHAVLVIGRRMKGEKCQFLVRNSWGTTRTRYPTEMDVENGNIWVDEELLAINSGEVRVLTDSSETARAPGGSRSEPSQELTLLFRTE